MQVRFTPGRLRIVIDEQELASLEAGEVVRLRMEWPGGGWKVTLDPEMHKTTGEHGNLRIGLRDHLETLTAPERAGLVLSGTPRISLELKR